MALVLAFQATYGFFFVLVWFESLHIDIEALADGFVGCLWSLEGDQGMCYVLMSVPLGQILDPVNLVYRFVRQAAGFLNSVDSVWGGYVSQYREEWDNYIVLPVLQV